MAHRARRRETTDILTRLSRVVGSSLDVDRALQAIGDVVIEVVGAPGVILWMVDEARQRLDRRLVVPDDLRLGFPLTTMTLDEGVAGCVAREGRILHLADATAEPRLLARDWWKLHGLQSGLAAPILVDDVAIGVLFIVAHEPFRDEDIALVEALTSYAAAALRNAAVYTRSETRRRAAEALAEVGRLLSQTLDPETVGRRVTESVCRLLDARSAAIYRLSDDGSLLKETTSSAGAFPWMQRLPTGAGIAGLALSSRRPIASTDIVSDARLTYPEGSREQFRGLPHRALLAVPLVAHGREFGVVTVGDHTGRRFSDDDMQLTQAFADQAAVALVNARLYGEVSRQAARMRALADVERLLSETLDADTIARRIVETLQGLLGSRVSALYRLEDHDFVVVALAGEVGPRFVTGVRFPTWVGLVSVAARERRPVQTQDILADPRITLTEELRSRIAGAAYRAALSIPLIVDERVVGALSVGDDAGRVYDEDDVRLSQAFADQAGRALENARLYEDAEARRREAEELAQVAAVISGSLDAATVLPRVLEAARRLTGADMSRIALRDPVRDVMVFRFADGTRSERADIERGAGLGGVAWTSAAAVRTDDRGRDPRLAGASAGPRASNLRAMIVVPMIIGGHVEGLLYVGNWSNLTFGPRHEGVLQRLADQAAIVLQNARLFADEQRARASAQAAAQALRESEAVLQRALEVGQIGSWTGGIGPDAELEWSHEVCRIFGVDPSTLTGTKEDFLSRVYPEDLAAIDAAREAAVAEGRPLRIDHRIVRPDGTLRWVHERADVVRDAAGRPQRLIGVVQDITERKQAEDALKAAEEQLRQSQKMEAIGRLAGGVAHDFNNLLSVISGRSELLLRRPLADLVHRDIDLIHKAAERAAGLTHQLLAFSRKQILQPKVIDLNVVVANMGKMLRRVIGEDVDLVIVARPGLAPVYADPGQLEQVVLNLAVNARDAMPGGGRLTIETAPASLARADGGPADAGPGRHVMLAVTDSGVGMDAAVSERIFEPFFTTKEVGKGTGLGLSTVYGIVQQSGGTIDVWSEPGRGTRFSIYLPGVDEPADASPGPEALPRGGTETVLLCEDEPALRQLAREVLEEYGYTVLEAGDGREALDVAAAHAGSIDLLVTDVVMPRMNGRELAARLTAARSLRVVYMSGYTETHPIRGRAPGAAFLQKPFSPLVLARTVRAVLDGIG